MADSSCPSHRAPKSLTNGAPCRPAAGVTAGLGSRNGQVNSSYCGWWPAARDRLPLPQASRHDTVRSGRCRRREPPRLDRGERLQRAQKKGPHLGFSCNATCLPAYFPGRGHGHMHKTLPAGPSPRAPDVLFQLSGCCAAGLVSLTHAQRSEI
ncbi:hypothetical protein GQ53DRAFT_751431 [Thozetella sp. PMI_491]|nr:hypothetical protein GQ53DRAFT_751431 [Thozetella sp. PMI_491]